MSLLVASAGLDPRTKLQDASAKLAHCDFKSRLHDDLANPPYES
jgi:hypothetical protein